MAPRADIEVGHDGIALITLINPPMNALHPNLLDNLFECLARAQANNNVKAIVLTGANTAFSAGFDIPTFVKVQNEPAVKAPDPNDDINALIENGKKPTVAAIFGPALGGGLELAMACNARICTSNSQLGLPELSLGILPGFGGTQRLPRLVGIQAALKAMLTSAPMKAAAALKTGLVDVMVDSKDQLIPTARQLALQLAQGSSPRRFSLQLADKLPSNLDEARMICSMAQQQAVKIQPNLEHPSLCVDAVLAGVEGGATRGLAKEKEVFNYCVQTEVGKALVHVFLAKGATKKVHGVTDVGLAPRPMRLVAVLGGGLMGSGIATALVLAGVQVLLKEVSQQFLDGGLGRIRSNVQSMVKRGKLTQEKADQVLGRVKGVLDLNDFGKADMVIEAVIEDIPLKQKIFQELEVVCSEECVLSSNTSTINILTCAAKMKQPNRIVGAHFFSPAHVMPLLEIVRTPQTPPQVVLDCIGMGLLIKKTPVVVGNCTGFAVNRVFFPYTMAALMLLDMGQDPYTLDKVISSEFGMPMGPIRLSDLVGGDIGLHVGSNMVKAFPDRVYQSAMVSMMNEAKRLGEKTGKGYYKFDEKRKAHPDPELMPFLEASRKAANLPPLKLSNEALIEFIFFPVVNEGCRVCDEGIVEKPSDLDIATILSMGFPSYRGGLIHWADTYGATYIAKRLKQFARMVPQHAGFFTPCEYLTRCALASAKLSSPPPKSKASL
mmetsp:Transcript_33969/g.47059  ORF Transcript_33969/g.47059 Transcript_33969/m.47059 type:complete len:721 (+) Transcript_33969:140-2302(+)|eukprot:CAMPEP_0196588942 /NCGR_PEP_ID=MMETSP1081-20130531/62151_1 /TAXON_ID=36882 /ORGANISM="Pyramimonas amylifera, Strain CCMP720" /LENGTH=720 /DNA_ID=CAMNT_0041911589 /DNA_START=136 /DNA_END=2298 /DNA_ORIENTATION=+